MNKKITVGMLTAALAAPLGIISGAHAQSHILNVAGTTTGSFTNQNANEMKVLTFTGTNFSKTTNSLGNGSFSLGTFSLNDSVTTGIDENFKLTVNFTSPIYINGDTTGTFPVFDNALIFGGTVKHLIGGVTSLNFTQSNYHLSYANSKTKGSFDFFVNPITISMVSGNQQASTSLTGHVSNAVSNPVPEPSTYAAFAFTGFGVMGLMLRARKSRGSMAS